MIAEAISPWPLVILLVLFLFLFLWGVNNKERK